MPLLTFYLRMELIKSVLHIAYNVLGFHYRTWVLKFQWRNLSLPSPIFSFTVLYHNSKVFPLTSSSLGTQSICQLTYWQNFSGLPDIWGPNEGILIFLSIIISFRISLLEVNPLIGCHTSLTINGTATYGPSVTKVLLKKKKHWRENWNRHLVFLFLWKNHNAHWASVSIIFQFLSFYFFSTVSIVVTVENPKWPPTWPAIH